MTDQTASSSNQASVSDNISKAFPPNTFTLYVKTNRKPKALQLNNDVTVRGVKKAIAGVFKIKDHNIHHAGRILKDHETFRHVFKGNAIKVNHCPCSDTDRNCSKKNPKSIPLYRCTTRRKSSEPASKKTSDAFNQALISLITNPEKLNAFLKTNPRLWKAVVTKDEVKKIVQNPQMLHQIVRVVQNAGKSNRALEETVRLLRSKELDAQFQMHAFILQFLEKFELVFNHKLKPNPNASDLFGQVEQLMQSLRLSLPDTDTASMQLQTSKTITTKDASTSTIPWL